MGKGRKVPPLPRRAPEVERQRALVEPSPEGERTGKEVAPEERSDQQPASFQAPASLPQRVRGAGERPRPPARLARAALPESFLERVRAAAEAAKCEAEQASSDSPDVVVPATTGSAFVAPPREAPATESPSPGPQARVAEAPVGEIPAAEAPAPDAASPVASTLLPRRVRGMSDGPRPPARVARPASSASLCWNACGPRSRLTLTPRLRTIPRNQPPSRPIAVRQEAARRSLTPGWRSPWPVPRPRLRAIRTRNPFR